MILGWATGGIIFGMMSDRLGRVKTMVVTLIDLLGVHRAVGHRALLGGLRRSTASSSDWASAACSARPRRSWPRACRAQFRAMALGLSPGALGARQHHRLADQPAHSARPHGFLRRAIRAGACSSSSASCPPLLIVPIMFVLKEPEAWLRAKAEAAAGGGRTSTIGSPLELFRDPRWRRNTHHRSGPRRLRDDRPVGHRFLLARADLDRAPRRVAAVVDRVRGSARRSRTSARSSGWSTFTLDRGVPEPPAGLPRRVHPQHGRDRCSCSRRCTRRATPTGCCR